MVRLDQHIQTLPAVVVAAFEGQLDRRLVDLLFDVVETLPLTPTGKDDHAPTMQPADDGETAPDQITS